MPRPKVKINIAELEKLCTMQCTDVEIAAWFGVSTRTIERRRANSKFGEAMEQGRAKGRVSVRRQLFKLASEGNIAAAIFLAKNLLGYKDYFTNEHSGPDGGPIQIGPAPELGDLSDDELKQLAVLINKTAVPRKG
jgi:hypothetical protein